MQKKKKTVTYKKKKGKRIKHGVRTEVQENQYWREKKKKVFSYWRKRKKKKI